MTTYCFRAVVLEWVQLGGLYVDVTTVVIDVTRIAWNAV